VREKWTAKVMNDVLTDVRNCFSPHSGAARVQNQTQRQTVRLSNELLTKAFSEHGAGVVSFPRMGKNL